MAASRSKNLIEKWVGLIAAMLVFALIAFVVIRNAPFADPNIVVLLRVVVAIAAGIFGGTIPGLLEVEWNLRGFIGRGTGALVLAVGTYCITPTVLKNERIPDQGLNNAAIKSQSEGRSWRSR